MRILKANIMNLVLATGLLLGLVGCTTQTVSESNLQSNNSPTDARQDIATNETTDDTGLETWTLDSTVGEIVAARPATGRIFELVGIDYCCGGGTQLKAAAAEKAIDANQLLNALLVVGANPTSTTERNWQKATLDELMEHIVTTHHAWLRRELPPLLATTQTVLRVHGDSHPELAEVAKTLTNINDAVLPHLDEEETKVFPALRKLAGGNPPDGIESQLVALRSDHDELGEQLHRLRELTKGFTVPEDACAKYREMLTGLESLEKDMLQHVHLENNILLPRASALVDRK
ncbi:MAG: iron-sulfur cluster repair di-iron protein [Pirellulaceae bacterium]